jgi:glycosyltransferase involved in cell wall biosynthesis
VREAGNLCPGDPVVVRETRPIHRAWRSAFQLGLARATKRWDLRSDLAVSDLVDDSNIQELFVEKPDAVICNYLSGLSVADKLVPKSRQILILHDLPRDALSHRVVSELATRSNTITLSADDTRCLAALSSNIRSEVGIPFPSIRRLTFRDMWPYKNLGEVLDACQPDISPPGGWSAQSDWASRHSLDLLFVGGSNPPNLEGLAEFVENCFLPHLQHRNVRLVVAGAVGPILWRAIQPPPGVTSLGRVADVRPLYASAKLVIVPLVRGTGISIKTLEAISLGKAVLSSPMGLRGLGDLNDLALPPPFDARWARRVMHLIALRTARRNLRDALVAKISDATLEHTLSISLRRVLGDAHLPSVDSQGGSSEPLATSPPLIEWPGPIRQRSFANVSPTQPREVDVLARWLEEKGFSNGDYCLDLADDIASEMTSAPRI